MKQIVKFSKVRFYAIALTVLLIVSGLITTVLHDGFNFGIDFQAGLSQRIQIAPVALSLTYEGADSVVVNVSAGVVRVELRDQDGMQTLSFPPAEYATVRDLAQGLERISGVKADVVGNPQAASADIVTGLGLPYVLSEEPVYLNTAHTDAQNYIEIQQFREAVEQLGSVQVQVVGNPVQQEFLLRVQDEEGGRKDVLEAQITTLLEGAFGEHTVVLKQSDYVGPRFSEALARQSIFLTVVALLLILLYVWFRFKLGFAVASISALAHDILFMIAFIGAFQIEINTATIAAVLTIIGYSLNDTIVVFDRIRENTEIMKERSFRTIIDASITQSLSRTLITSLTTLIAVTALFIFGTGLIRDFSLNLIVGVVVGTYSSIFVASPVLLEWVQHKKKRLAKRLGKKYDPARGEILETAPAGNSGASRRIEAPQETAKQQQQTRKEVKIEQVDRKLKGKRQKSKKKK